MKKFRLFFLMIMIASFQGHARPNVDIQKIIQERVDKGLCMSIVVGYVDSDGVSFYQAGKTAKDGEFVDENTIYEIGSITKTVTGLLLQQEIDEGKVELEDSVEGFLPGVQLPERNEKKILFRHLVTHTSGFPYMPSNFTCKDISNPFEDYNEEDLYAFCKYYSLPRDPGAEYEYSNLGMGLVGHILSLLEKKSFEDLVQERICRPLSMTSTFIHVPEGKRHFLAKGHIGDKEVPNWDLSVLAGAGALFSSVNDLSKYLMANMGMMNTILYSSMKKTHKELFPRTDRNYEKIALCWHLGQEGTPGTVWHNGGTGGYHSFIGFYPEKNIGVIVLTNSITNIDDIGRHVLDQRYKLRPIDNGITLDPIVLKQYTGKYRHSSGLVFTINQKGDLLTAHLTGYPTVEIYPKTDKEFFLKIVTAEIFFHFGEDGEVVGLTFQQGGQRYEADKINDYLAQAK
jgi:CubicO group peptidase (beta-lactamase class C family)